MSRDEFAAEHKVLAWCLQQPTIPAAALRSQCPNFLIISPPKTGTTWLAHNLRHLPTIFIPPAKELKYFSTWFECADFNWYLSQFRGAAELVKGEATPDYALLPAVRIRLIRRLMPSLKLVFLMRDPVARAWSHARHCFRHREANFAGCGADINVIGDDRWAEALTHEWVLGSGDYLGQLRRWLSVFPPEQILVDFYESIARDPERLLHRILDFLAVDADVDLAHFPTRERILPGLPKELPPALSGRLHRLWRDRTIELAYLLRSEFDLEVPPDWVTISPLSAASAAPNEEPPEVFRRDLDDPYVTRVLDHAASFPSSERLLLEEYRGFQLSFHRGTYCAIDLSAGRVGPWQLGEEDLRRARDLKRCLDAGSLDGLRQCVNRLADERFEEQHVGLGNVERELAELRGRLEGQIHLLADSLRIAEASIRLLRPLIAMARVFRPIWRGLRRVIEFGKSRAARPSKRERVCSRPAGMEHGAAVSSQVH